MEAGRRCAADLPVSRVDSGGGAGGHPLSSFGQARVSLRYVFAAVAESGKAVAVSDCCLALGRGGRSGAGFGGGSAGHCGECSYA